MPSDRTTVTELGTGLGMLGLGDIDEAIEARPAVMHSLSPEMWQHLDRLRAGGAYDAEFHAAWENGRAFLTAVDGLRGRLPRIVEWKGTGRAPGDEVAPIDLRVDHVYLVSCKYLSDILFNVSPASVFDSLLVAGPNRTGRGAATSAGEPGRAGGGPSGGDWYAEVAPTQYQALYDAVRAAAARGDDGVPPRRTPRRDAGALARAGQGGMAPALPGLASLEAGVDGVAGVAGVAGVDVGMTADGAAAWDAGRSSDAHAAAAKQQLQDLPPRASDLTSGQRVALGKWLRSGWPPGVKELYATLSDAVARASVRRWEAAMDRGVGSGESMLWRLLRIGSAPYFVLGASAERSLRLRIATSWDWRQHFALDSISFEAQRGGQPRVGWLAVVRDRSSAAVSEVAGHIEVRWSHGRFGGPPEAKGYLDTSHHLVPGYFALQ